MRRDVESLHGVIVVARTEEPPDTILALVDRGNEEGLQAIGYVRTDLLSEEIVRSLLHRESRDNPYAISPATEVEVGKAQILAESEGRPDDWPFVSLEHVIRAVSEERKL